jgi:cold shock CspA family protein
VVHEVIHQGSVTSFDEARGLGVVRAEAGEWPFHCTAIADGSRRITEGTTVTFRIVAGQLGRWEATELTPLH